MGDSGVTRRFYGRTWVQRRLSTTQEPRKAIRQVFQARREKQKGVETVHSGRTHSNTRTEAAIREHSKHAPVSLSQWVTSCISLLCYRRCKPDGDTGDCLL